MADPVEYLMPCCEVTTTEDMGILICPSCRRGYDIPQKMISDLPSQRTRDTVPKQESPIQENNPMTITDSTPTEATEAEDTSTVAPDPVAKPKRTREGARPKGELENMVKTITDAYSDGTLTEHDSTKPLTPHAIAQLIAKRFGLAKAPSAGAVTANLDRWADLGFAVMSDTKPLAFAGYTPDAIDVGLTEMKARKRVAASEARKAAKAAAPAAEATPAPAAAPADEWEMAEPESITFD